MTERITQPSEASKCNWASGGSAYPNADPGSGVRDVGYKPKDYPTPGAGAVIPAEDHNFLWRLGMEMLSWLRDIAARQWTELAEGSDAAANNERHMICLPDTGPRERGSVDWTITGTGTGGTGVYSPCTDGGYIYYFGGTTSFYLIAADPDDGSEVWEQDVYSVAFSALCCDGAYVYAQTVDSGEVGLKRLERTNGDHSGEGGSEYGCEALAANGEYCVGIDPTTHTGYAVFYSDIQGTITEDGTVNIGSSNLTAVAIDSDQAYVGGVRNTYDVWAFTLSTRAYAWGGGVLGWTAATSSAITVSGIAADGNRVYVCSDRQGLSAGGSANLFCIDRRTGQTLWTMDVTTPGAVSTLDLEGIAVDDQYLYCVDDGDDLHIIDIAGPTPAQVAFVSNFGLPDCDGVSVIGNSNLTTELKRVWSGGTAKTFLKTTTDSVHRRPFFNRSIPSNTRI